MIRRPAGARGKRERSDCPASRPLRATSRPAARSGSKRFFPLDWIALHASPVYYGFGVPRGHGEPVVLVPGFLGSDRYLTEMHLWLRRVGYAPYFSGIGRNVDCPEILTQRLLMTIRQAYEDTRHEGDDRRPQPRRHARARGRASRAIDRRAGDHDGLAVPLAPRPSARPQRRELRAVEHRPRAQAPPRGDAELLHAATARCGFVRTLQDEEAVEPYGTAAIYSKCDGIVDWHSCVEDDAALNNEVTATHIGMAFNPDVYRTVANLLAGVQGA